MWSMIKNNIPGVAMITGTGALYGFIMEPDGGFAVLAALGACFGGLAAVGLFGHPGRGGWGLAALGAFVATALGAGLAGAYLYFPEGLWIAPVMVAIYATDMLLAGPVWLSLMAATHLTMRRIRAKVPDSGAGPVGLI